MNTITLKPNTVKDRGLPDVFQAHREISAIDWATVLTPGSVVTVYEGAHARAFDTIAWFAYGERPE